MKNPLKITDVTLRDGHQSLFATRLRTEDMVPIAPDIDEAGFYALEVWGGATFDVATRYLNEDPWWRLETLKGLVKKTPLQMLLRGQNLVGYRNYADDVTSAFVRYAAGKGVDIFRVFDALNDERNFITSLEAIKSCGKHAQLSICYSLTEPRMGGPVYNLDYYIEKATTFEKMGADSLCIKDMAGLMAPDDAYKLVSTLRQVVHIPIQLHTHYTSGMASMTVLKAVEAGVDMIDAALAPFALRSSHPAIEPIASALRGTDRDTGLDLRKLFKLDEYFESIAPKYRDFLDSTKVSVIDTSVLLHQIPGGMISNLVSQLKEAGALDRIEEVYEELPKVRKELGYPPLVTPTSQIVGIQAVQNVLFGRYKVIPAQVKDYCYGLYGHPPAPIDPEVQKKVLKGYERGETPITCRPADILEPELDRAYEATKDIARDLGDVLIYALYPTTGMRFLRWKYGLEEPPPETKPKTLDDIKKEDELIARIRAGEPLALPGVSVKKAPQKFNVYIEDEVYTVAVAPAESTVDDIVALEEKTTPGKDNIGESITAPMPGIILRYEAKAGESVKAGDTIVVIEAMKMAIDLTTPVDGTVKSITYKNGDRVNKDDILAVISYDGKDTR